MREVVRWMAAVFLFCALAAAAADGGTDARLMEAQTAIDEALKLKEARKYAEAISQAERALPLREAVLGGTHLEVATTLNLLGELYRLKGELARAEPLYERGLAIREAALGKDHVLVAEIVSNLGVLYYSQGAYARAEPLIERALAIREAALGKNHPQVADSLNNLAVLYVTQGLFTRAEPLHERGLAILEAALGKEDPQVAKALNNLAYLHVQQGLYARAEPLYQRALAIREAVLGKNHPDSVETLNNLGTLYLRLGLYSQAEPLLQRSLEAREAAFGKNHLDTAYALNNLGYLYATQGLYDRAEPLFQRVLVILEATLGKKHSIVANLLNNLGYLYGKQGLYAKSEAHFQRGLAILEEALGKNHPQVAYSLSGLAVIYARQGLYARARPLSERALAITEASLGKDHPDVTGLLNGLAHLYMEEGLYARAEPLHQRSLAIREAALGTSHPLVGETLTNLARLRLAQRRLGEALPLLDRAFAISEKRLRQEALDFSESRLASFLQHLRSDEERYYALLRAHPDDANVRRLALTAVLLLKGRSVEEIAGTSRTVYRSLGPGDRDTFERLRGLRTQRAKLALDGPGSRAPADYQQRLKELTEQGDALEAELATRSAPLRSLTALPPPQDMVGQVAAALPKDGARIEFIAYTDKPLVPKPRTPDAKIPRQLRYLALVLFPDGNTRALDLGPAEKIDRAASRLRDAYARRDASYQAPAQALYSLAFRPLLPLLGNARRLFLAPDGLLGVVPFAALHDGRRFLVDAFDFTYLTSGKDLLPRTLDVPKSRSVVVLADPDFGTLPAALPASSNAAATLTERSHSLESFFSSPRAGLAEEPWMPLPGTRQEAESLQRLFPQAQLFLGPDASKERLLRLATPGILHIATHGFFLEDAAAPKGTRAIGSFGALGSAASAQQPPDPLLRSGLVLAGVRAPAAQSTGTTGRRLDASLVTALELAGLDLWGTELVVLSACDTGRGEAKLGQGIYGMRRALVVAGAETLVMSLWKVRDDTTHLLMEQYYRKLLEGQGRATALNEAMRALRVDQPHPHFWAPVVALGRDAPWGALGPPTQVPPKP